MNWGDSPTDRGIQDPLTEQIIVSCFDVHNVLGGGFLEAVYRNALIIELRKRGLDAHAEVPIVVKYAGEPVGHYVADIVVHGRIICELKATERLITQQEAQLVNYLTATGIDVGLLVNFGQRVTVKRKFRLRRSDVA
ncbi:MAG: GxxExxY protein [Rhodospirillaceae bacterium]